MPNSKSLPNADDDVVFRTAWLFLEGLKASKICDQLRREYPTLAITREGIYPLLAKAKLRGFLRLVPPLETTLAERIAERFPRILPSDIRVVSTGGKAANEFVSAVAAEVALDLIKDLGRQRIDPIGIGLGPGKATLDFSKHLSELLNAETDRLPKLKLFAITAGCSPTVPEYAPISFFNLFPSRFIQKEVGRVGLFAETLLSVKEFDAIKKNPGPGVRDCFRDKGQIRLVVTAMGDLADPHDLLGAFLKGTKTQLESLGAIGNVQYRPFGVDRIIRERPHDLRAFTLFELDELVQMSRQKDRHVILIARQCGLCGTNRARVLRPLLEVDELRVFSKIVMDVDTAQDLLQS